MIYLVDSIIQFLNNWALVDRAEYYMNIKFIWSIYIFKYNLLIQIKNELYIICYSKSNKLTIPSYYLQVTAKLIRKVKTIKEEMIP